MPPSCPNAKLRFTWKVFSVWHYNVQCRTAMIYTCRGLYGYLTTEHEIQVSFLQSGTLLLWAGACCWTWRVCLNRICDFSLIWCLLFVIITCYASLLWAVLTLNPPSRLQGHQTSWVQTGIEHFWFWNEMSYIITVLLIVVICVILVFCKLSSLCTYV